MSFQTGNPEQDNAPAPQQQEGFQQPQDQSGLEKRLHDKDDFIETLKAERREDAEKLSAYEQKLADMQERLEALSSKVVDQPPAGEPESKPGLSLEDVDSYLAQREQANAQQSNMDKVSAAMAAQYGDGWAAKLDDLAVQKGMTPAMAVELAKSSPEFFIQSFGGTVPANNAPTRSSINTQAVPPVQEETKVDAALLRNKDAYKTEMLRRLEQATKK